MRIAVISDIHGNCFALDAALAEIRKSSVDKIVCLGDTVQGGPQPKETVKRLRQISCPIVMGNADAWLLNEEADSVEPTAKEQREVRAWTLSKLSTIDMDFIRNYQPTIRVPLDTEQSLLCFHGSPQSYDDILLPDTQRDVWDRLLGPYSPAIMTGGHTHTQQIRRLREGLFFNPGSIGLAYNYTLPENGFHADPWAEYAILTYDSKRFSLEFRRAYYDLEKFLRLVKESGRPNADRTIHDYKRP